ncbi:hypothetical protein R1sor_004404 [Riccia sorocarpa]|uniref:Endonuclease/exonuclease/phosphatase domain-containing protein n=1 Tax=Riccia sorocarpa TaxID=122646 RepID=A0ABD3HGK8_9MARC
MTEKVQEKKTEEADPARSNEDDGFKQVKPSRPRSGSKKELIKESQKQSMVNRFSVLDEGNTIGPGAPGEEVRTSGRPRVGEEPNQPLQPEKTRQDLKRKEVVASKETESENGTGKIHTEDLDLDMKKSGDDNEEGSYGRLNPVNHKDEGSLKATVQEEDEMSQASSIGDRSKAKTELQRAVEAEEGKEVSFDGRKSQFLSQTQWGRAPKKRGKGKKKSKENIGYQMEYGQVNLDEVEANLGVRLKQAGKRRALESLEWNGCRLSTTLNDKWSQEDENKRLRKKKDESLCQMMSWNVRGIGKPRKARIVKSWITKNMKEASVLALQELKVLNWSSLKWLKDVRSQGTVVLDLDKPIGKKGGTVLILHKDWIVESSGVSGRGRFAWGKVRQGENLIGFLSIHAPNKRSDRVRFWRELQDIIGGENWFILGDYNQVEMQEDSRGKSAVLAGHEARVWRQMTLEEGQVDGFFCAASIEGSRFTRFASRRGRYDFARLDRIYMTGGAQWLDHVKELKHFGVSVYF